MVGYFLYTYTYLLSDFAPPTCRASFMPLSWKRFSMASAMFRVRALYSCQKYGLPSMFVVCWLFLICGLFVMPIYQFEYSTKNVEFFFTQYSIRLMMLWAVSVCNGVILFDCWFSKLADNVLRI